MIPLALNTAKGIFCFYANFYLMHKSFLKNDKIDEATLVFNREGVRKWGRE